MKSNSNLYPWLIHIKMISEMCTGSYMETDRNEERPPAGTKCVGPCLLASDGVSPRWGSSYCYTSENEEQWGAECVLCSGIRF